MGVGGVGLGKGEGVSGGVLGECSGGMDSCLRRNDGREGRRIAGYSEVEGRGLEDHFSKPCFRLCHCRYFLSGRKLVGQLIGLSSSFNSISRTTLFSEEDNFLLTFSL